MRRVDAADTFTAVVSYTDLCMLMRKTRLLVVAISVAAILCSRPATASAQAAETGFLNRSVSVDGVERRYQVYVPSGYQRSTPLPVILALHGGGEYGTNGISQTDGGLARAIRRHPERFNALVVFPQSPPGAPGFQGPGERIALTELDTAISEFNGDTSRVYLTGLSMGGNGAWYLAYHHPNRFAALLVVCGFVEEFTGTTSGTHYPPIVATGNPFAAIAKNIPQLPIWIFHGDADRTVSVEQSRQMFSALKAIGANVQYTELAGVPHNAWDPAYERAEVFTWLFQQKRR